MLVPATARPQAAATRASGLVLAAVYVRALKAVRCRWLVVCRSCGFHNIFGTENAVVNVSDLNRFEDGAVVTAADLVEAGLVKKTLDGVKVLGNGEITKKLTVQAAAFSASAKEKIEAAGGKAEVV